MEKLSYCHNETNSSYSRLFTAIVLLVLTLGILLRMLCLGEIPPGLYHDEVWNGLDAIETLAGGCKVFYPNNFGREPVLIWLTAPSIRFLGNTPLAVRLPASILGILALPACYLLARELFGRRVALWALAIMAFTVWPIHLSRVAFRAVGFCLVGGLALWQIVRGCRTRRWRHWILGGVLTGAAFYTYSTARFTPIAAVVYGVYMLLTHRPLLSRSLFSRITVYLVICAFLLLPLVIYAISNPEAILQRAGQVSILRPNASLDQSISRFLTSAAKTLGMFHWRGDFQLRHNVPNRPVFDVVTGILFLVGCYECVRRFRQPRYAFVLIWVVVMLGPTVLTQDAPHFLRASGVWPVVALLPALGLRRVWEWIAQRKGNKVAVVVTGTLLCLGLSATVYDYFSRYPRMEEVNYWFEDAGVQLSHDVNTFLESGWTRGEWVAQERPARTDRRVYVDLQLWKDWLNAHFLIPNSPSFIVPGSGDRPGAPDGKRVPTQLYAWNDPRYPGFWLPEMDWLPRNVRIEMQKGPLATTYWAPEPHPAYVVFTATPYEMTPDPLAVFEPGVELITSTVSAEGESVHVQLTWLTRQPIPLDYTIFVHVEQDGTLTAQHDDGPLGGCPSMVGCVPMTHWRPGNMWVEPLNFILPQEWDPERDAIWAGMYYWQDLKRLEVTSDRLTVVEGRVRIFPSDARP